MKVHLAGHLNWYDEHKRTWVEVQVTGVILLGEVLKMLGIPTGEVAIALVNGKQVDMHDTWLMDNDQLELFPPVSGG